MKDFFKRNLVWVAIILCIIGVILSIIGIPSGQPIFFFVGIILALPTIGYLVYQVFFYRDKVELDLAPTTAKFSSSNVTSVVSNRNDVLLNDQITNDDDLEPLYHGYANDQEVAKRLTEVTNSERERAIIELPEIVLPEAKPNYAFDHTTAITNTTNDELARQRTAAVNAPATFATEVPLEMAAEPAPVVVDHDESEELTIIPVTDQEPVESVIEPVSESQDLSLTDPNYVPTDKPVMPQNLTPVDLTNAKIIRTDPVAAGLRRQKAQEKKALLSQTNLERYLKHYLIETAACFLMNRTIYKDKFGIAPYNKFAVNKTTNLPEYSMSCTKGRLYKFCTYLIDAERFITHPAFYEDFTIAIEKGVSLARISESLHHLYRKKYKKDFILNLSNREDWDNLMILVYNNYLLNNDNFKNVFTRVPFEIPASYNDENVIEYLKNPNLQDRFAERYPALEEMGIPTFWDALYICFINAVKQKLTIEQIESAILRDYKKITRALKKADTARRKALLKKES